MYKVICYDDFEGSYAEFKIKGNSILKSENYSPFVQCSNDEYLWYIKHSSRIEII